MEEIKPPRRLFSRIIKRLGFEKQLLVIKRNLGFFVGGFVVFVFLSVFAIIGLREVLSKSSFGPFIFLVFSDPWIVFKNWHSFSFSIFESVPGFNLVALLLAIAVLLMFIRLASLYLNKFLEIIKKINKQKQYGNK